MITPSSDWVLKYIQLMLADKPEEAIPLKSDHFPDQFFRYCPLSAYTFLNLENDQLWLSPIEALNDPFECTMTLDHLASIRMFFNSALFKSNLQKKSGICFTDAEMDQIVSDDDPYTVYQKLCASKGFIIDQTSQEFKERITDRWQGILKDSRKMLRVCCFTGRRDSILMWSHYANNHAGICLEYDFQDSSEFRFLLQPIYYRDDFFQVSTMEDFTFISYLMSALQKSTDWSYEQEWRVTGIPKSGGTVPDTVKAPIPNAIYLGMHFERNEPADKARLREIARDKKIPLIQMSQDPTAYRIVPKMLM